MTDAKPDGRHERARATRERIVTACRTLMLGGNFRPGMREVAAAAGCSVRSVFQHFTAVEGLHRAALDPTTRHDIACLIAGRPPYPPSTECIVHAAVFGRPLAVADTGGEP